MSEPQELSKALLAEGRPKPLDHALEEVRSMIATQQSRARFWTRLCLIVWALAFCLSGLSIVARGTTGTAFLTIMPFTVALAVISTIRLFFVRRAGDINRTREQLLELRAEIAELKARQDG